MLDSLSDFNIDVYLYLQDWMGRSWLFDSLITLATDNQFVKAVVIGCSFVAAWFTVTDETIARTRKILTLTILAGVLAIGLGKLTSKTVLSPRPLLFASAIYTTSADEFSKANQLDIRMPLDSGGIEYYRGFQSGDFDDDDLVSFPSDHAALFIAMSVGILFAHRGYGLLALTWTLVVILLPRVMSGMHWPVDIAAGGLIGATCSVALIGLFSRRTIPILDRLINWSLSRPAFSSALLFAVVFEACNSFYNLRLVLKFAREAARHLLGS